MDSESKARKLLDEGRVFYIGTKGDNMYFVVKGSEGAYKVRREVRNGKVKYFCDPKCKAKVFAEESCYHVLACEIFVSTRGLI